MRKVRIIFAPKEKVIYLKQTKDGLRPIEAIVVKMNKTLIRIRAKLDGVRWSFVSVRQDELEKVA
jgi:hypothetical protein